MKKTKDSYTINDVRYNRVTSVLDYFMAPELHKWVLKVGKDAAKKKGSSAKRIGTRVHNLAKTVFDRGSAYLTPHDNIEVKNCLTAYQRWLHIEKPKILKMEQTVVSDSLGIAGTYDIALSDTIVDIKTSVAIRPSYWLQVAMYAYLSGSESITKIAILRLDKYIGEYEYKVIDFDMRLVDTYKGLLDYYRYIQCFKVKKKTKEVSDGDNITATEIEEKLSVFSPENRGNRSCWDWEK